MKTLRRFFAFTLVLGMLLPVALTAAPNAYLELTLNGLDIEGEPLVSAMGGTDVSDQIECLAFNHEVFLSGTRRTHGPIKFVKRVDKSSVLLMKGFDFNENGTARFRFFRQNATTGETEHFYTVELTNVRVSAIRTWFPNTLDPAAASYPYMEEVSLTYTGITITHEIANYSHSTTVAP
jgi:type VI secretion system Hcp family effector